MMKGVEEREDLFAAVPPLESKNLMFRMVREAADVASRNKKSGRRMGEGIRGEVRG